MKCKVLLKKYCLDEKFNQGINELRIKVMLDGHRRCFKKTSKYGVKKKEFYNLLDLHDKDADFSNDLHALYEVYVHLHHKKCYTQMNDYKEEIEKLFYRVCRSASWRDKNTILSFLQIAKMNCSSDRIPRWNVFYPTLMSLFISFPLFVIGILINLETILIFDSPIVNLGVYILYVNIIPVLIIFGGIAIYYRSLKKKLKEESNRYKIIENFVTICANYVENMT